jgi:hypothetical protein
MVGFEVNGEFLDLPDNLTVELARNSPLFQQDGSIIEDYTFSISFPATPKKQKDTGFSVHSRKRQPTQSCMAIYAFF